MISTNNTVEPILEDNKYVIINWTVDVEACWKK